MFRISQRKGGGSRGALPGLCRAVFAGVALATFAGCGGGTGGPNPSGTLEAVETDITSVLAARILEVRPRLGDRVAAGDTLVVLDTELLVLQRGQTEAGRLSITAQREAARSALAQAQRNLELAELTLGRSRALLEQGSAAPQQVDELQAKRDVLADQVSAARHQIETLDAEEARLDAVVAVYDRQIRDGVIVAPRTGTVILRNAEPGEVAAPGAVLLRLADLENLELRVFLAEEELDRVKLGQELRVLVDALRDERLAGRVIWISAEAEFTPKNAQTRQARTQLVYAVKLSVLNPTGRLHIGMPAEVQL